MLHNLKKALAALLISTIASAGTIEFTQLPLNSASSTTSGDIFPMVNVTSNTAEKLTLYDLVNIPAMVSKYAPLASPTFTGTLTAPTISGTNGTWSGTVVAPTLTGGTGSFTGAFSALSFSGIGTSLTALNASNITSGTLPAAQLPNPTASTLGGVESVTSTSHQFLNTISTSGVPGKAQPAFTDISGTATTGQIPALPYAAVIRTQVFTSSGTYTPNANLLYAIIECVGGGGSGGGTAATSTNYAASGGGAGGGYGKAIASAATIGASQTVTIGGGGAAPSAGNNNGNPGVQTSVGTLCVAGPGGQGFGSAAQSSGFGPSAGGGAGGGATTSTFGVGFSSGGGVGLIGTLYAVGGHGGSSMYGLGATDNFQSGSSAAGSAGTGYGAGGSGAASQGTQTAKAGGAGTSGAAFITEFDSQ